MTGDETHGEWYQYPPRLQQLVETRKAMHTDRLNENGWTLEEGDCLSDVIDTGNILDEIESDEISENVRNLIRNAYEWGMDEGSRSTLHLVNRVAADEFTAVTFTDEDSLQTAVTDRFTSHWQVNRIEEHDDGTATVVLDYEWSEITETDGFQHLRLAEVVSETAVPHGRDGYIIDFGSRTDLHAQFTTAQYEADDSDIETLPSPDESEADIDAQ